MFSQWATKRVVKFAMKHLLGRILRNELDLEQLDVQIGSGTIHLKDLALNIDYFNDQVCVLCGKFGDSLLLFRQV